MMPDKTFHEQVIREDSLGVRLPPTVTGKARPVQIACSTSAADGLRIVVLLSDGKIWVRTFCSWSELKGPWEPEPNTTPVVDDISNHAEKDTK